MQRSQLITCPVWHKPLLRVVAGGIEVKCRSCKATHFTSKAQLLAIWDQLEREHRTPSA